MRGSGLHCTGGPLDFFDNVQAAVHDELVHVSRFLVKTRYAVAALLRGAEFMLEERIVLRAYDSEVIGHGL